MFNEIFTGDSPDYKNQICEENIRRADGDRSGMGGCLRRTLRDHVSAARGIRAIHGEDTGARGIPGASI
jgi:hypothetical protein